MLLLLLFELDDIADDKANWLDDEEEEAAILLLEPVVAKSPELDADSLLEAAADEELLDAADMAQDPSGET